MRSRLQDLTGQDKKKGLAQVPQSMPGISLHLTEFSPQLKWSMSLVSLSGKPWVVNREAREKYIPAVQSEVFRLDQILPQGEFPKEEKPTEGPSPAICSQARNHKYADSPNDLFATSPYSFWLEPSAQLHPYFLLPCHSPQKPSDF